VSITGTLRIERKLVLRDPITMPWVEMPGQALMTGIVTAGAVVACADGVAERSERQALLSYLRKQNLLIWSGRSVVLETFDARVAQLQSGSPEDLRGALDVLRTLTGRRRVSLIATAAAHVALADGQACSQEIMLLRIIRDRLGLTDSPR
jgi:tellurite resistance protein